ncbi:MAG: hypothetical protein HZB30_05185 [Nitrospirae bacterium]|nr:hypothetical protein [Nitrospirota bacterium]
MNRFKIIIFVVLYFLSLALTCAKPPEQISYITSSKTTNLSQSRGFNPLPLIQGDTSGTSVKDFLNTSAASQPDLIVKSISGFPALPASIESGSSFTVITKIKNKGKGQAYFYSIVQYYLSANNSYSSEDILLIGSRTVPIMQSKKTSIGSTKLTIPSATPPGKYYLISCADDKKNIIENNENNNCKASKTTVQVINNSVQVPLPLNYNFQVTQGLPYESSFSVSLSAGPANYNNISLNLQDILSNSVTITPGPPVSSMMKLLNMFISSAEAQSAVNMSMFVRIGAFASTVCQEGLLYGPYAITGSSSSPAINPPTASAEPSTINIINSGSFAMCIQIYSQTDAAIDVGTPSIDVTQCNQPPADISGTWKGTYTCINHGYHNDVDQPITLTITQIGNRAQYIDDGGDKYEGTVCGDVFKFNRNDPDETESGTFVLSKNGKGTKTSTWTANYPSTNWGNCTDHLHR